MSSFKIIGLIEYDILCVTFLYFLIFYIFIYFFKAYIKSITLI